MAIINYRATTVGRAFTLNALATALIAIITVQTKAWLDSIQAFNSDFARTLGAFFAGFVSALIIYWLMFFVFDFGGGMLADPNEPVEFKGFF